MVTGFLVSVTACVVCVVEVVVRFDSDCFCAVTDVALPPITISAASSETVDSRFPLSAKESVSFLAVVSFVTAVSEPLSADA